MRTAKITLLAMAAALFTCLCLLVACNVPGSSSSSDTATGETGSAPDDSGTATATSRLNEDVTAPVRYDYLSADVSSDVDIDLLPHPTVNSAIIIAVKNAILFLNFIQTPPFYQ